VHRIGRTGRAGADGLALSLSTPREAARASAIEERQGAPLQWYKATPLSGKANNVPPAAMTTLRIDAGRSDKLRPGDILGALTGEAGLKADAIGKIDVFATRAYVAVARGQASQALARLREGTEAAAFGRNGAALAEVFQYVLEGRAAMLAGAPEAAATAYRKAMNRQLAAEFGNDPPLFWYSVRRSLAAAQLEAGDAEGARRQLNASLRTWPNDPLALYALSIADRRLGDTQSADRNLARARAAWAGDVTSVPLARI
jgi:superfamily II DNA/RNA helicase